MKTCLFGGSFDPVHAGHLAMALAAERELATDRIVFLPAAQSPFKSGEPPLFTPKQRLAMLRAAVEGWSEAEVSELDLSMNPPSWSWRLVESWLKQNPNDELYWLLGTDEWEQLHRWAKPDYLAEHLTFAVYSRGMEPRRHPGVRSVFLTGPLYEVSSSEVRRCLERRLPLPDGWMPSPVEKLARRYMDRPCSEDAECQAKK